MPNPQWRSSLAASAFRLSLITRPSSKFFLSLFFTRPNTHIHTEWERCLSHSPLSECIDWVKLKAPCTSDTLSIREALRTNTNTADLFWQEVSISQTPLQCPHTSAYSTQMLSLYISLYFSDFSAYWINFKLLFVQLTQTHDIKQRKQQIFTLRKCWQRIFLGTFAS